MPNSREAAVKATAATDAIAGQAAIAAQQAILARQAQQLQAQRAEFTYIAGLPPTRRTVAQNNRLALFLASTPRTQQAGPTAIHALSTAVQVIEVARGGTIYRINDNSDGFYVVVDGRVVLYDVKDRDEAEEDDGVVDRLGRTECFGEEDLIANSRRAHRAEVGSESSALLLRVPPELYRKHLQHLHQPDFEDKVEFLGRLEVFRTLPEETLRKLAPCFSQVELRAKEYLVRQGERADSMYAIAAGQCSVLVDPNYRPEMHMPAEADPKKLMQVCLIGPGNIVGDMTVLANVRKRTATIFCIADLVAYKIRRATFIRRVPPGQLEALRQVAEAKIKITERRVLGAAAGPGGGKNAGPVLITLRDKILHGHQLRQLSQPQGVGPLDLRGYVPGGLSSGVEALLANSLAAAAAATSPTRSAGGAGPVSDGGAGAVAAAAIAAAAAASGGGATAAGLAEMRERFSMPRKSASMSASTYQAATAAGGAAAAAAGALCPGTRVRGSGGGTSALANGLRGADINYTWGLGPGTMINALLERPATAGPTVIHGVVVRRSHPIDGRAASTHGFMAQPHEHHAEHAHEGGSGGSGGGGGGGRGVAFVAAPPSAPSAAAPLQPTYARQPHAVSPFGGGRVGSARAGGSPTLLPQPRGSSPQMPAFTSEGHGPPVGLPYTPIVAWTSNAADAGAAVGVRSRSPHLGGIGSTSAGERLASALAAGSRSSLSGATGGISGGGGSAGGAPSAPAAPSLLRPGPLIIGPPAPSNIEQLLQQRHGSVGSAGHSPSRGHGHGGDWLAPSASAFAVASAAAAAAAAEASLSGSPRNGSPGKSETEGGGLHHSHRHHRSGSHASFLVPEGDSPGEGSEREGQGEGSGRRRREPRRQRSMGKARFSRSVVTQNSSVDALVAEVLRRASEAAYNAEAEAEMEFSEAGYTTADPSEFGANTAEPSEEGGLLSARASLLASPVSPAAPAAEALEARLLATEASESPSAGAEAASAEAAAAAGQEERSVEAEPEAPAERVEGREDRNSEGEDAADADAETGPGEEAGEHAAPATDEAQENEDFTAEDAAAGSVASADEPAGGPGETAAEAEAPLEAAPSSEAAAAVPEAETSSNAAAGPEAADVKDADLDAEAVEAEGDAEAVAAASGEQDGSAEEDAPAAAENPRDYDDAAVTDTPGAEEDADGEHASEPAGKAAAQEDEDCEAAEASTAGAAESSAEPDTALGEPIGPPPAAADTTAAQLTVEPVAEALAGEPNGTRPASSSGGEPRSHSAQSAHRARPRSHSPAGSGAAAAAALAAEPPSQPDSTGAGGASGAAAAASSRDEAPGTAGATPAAQPPQPQQGAPGAAAPTGRRSLGGNSGGSSGGSGGDSRGGVAGAVAAAAPVARISGRPAQPAQPITLQLVVPDGPYGRPNPSSPRRAQGASAAPNNMRQYPFVGPFLSITKGVFTPASAAARVGAAGLKQLMSPGALPVVPRFGSLGGSPRGEGERGMARFIFGAEGGVAVSSGMPARGQLRKGSLVQRSTSAPRGAVVGAL